MVATLRFSIDELEGSYSPVHGDDKNHKVMPGHTTIHCTYLYVKVLSM